MIGVNDQDQTSALPAASENTDDLFGDDAAQGDGESVPSKDAQVADPKSRLIFLLGLFMYFIFRTIHPFCTKQLPPGPFICLLMPCFIFMLSIHCLKFLVLSVLFMKGRFKKILVLCECVSSQCAIRPYL